MRAREFIVVEDSRNPVMTPQRQQDLRNQSDYGGEDPDARDQYGNLKRSTSPGLGGSIDIGGVSIPADAIDAGLGSMGAIGGMKAIFGKSQKAPPPTSTKAPATQNVVVPAMVGRPKPEDVTHAYRTMKPEELQHAQSTGHFTAKDPTRDNRKWWTAHTAEPKGIGGLEKSTEPYPGTNVRVPIDKVPSDTAVNANHAEFWNRETGAWTPVISGVPAP
jgi:hypothetical protein